MEKQNNSNSIEERIKGLGKQIALTDKDEDKQRNITKLDKLCTQEIIKNSRASTIKIIPSILFSVAFIILSALCFYLSFAIINFTNTKANESDLSEFFINIIFFVVHLLVYLGAFLPVYVLAFFAPVGYKIMGVCAFLENLLLIFLVNQVVNEGVFELTNGLVHNIFVRLLGIIILLIVVSPAIIVGLFGNIMIFSKSNS
jgi:hypothetical protein